MKKKIFVILFIAVLLTAVAFSRPSGFGFEKNLDFGGSDALYSMLKEERENFDGYKDAESGEIYSGAVQNENYSAYAAIQNENYLEDTTSRSGEFYSYSGGNPADAAVETSVSKRLVVKARAKLNSFGAVSSFCVGGFYIFQYAEREDAEKAYAYFSAQKSVESVEFDAVLYLSKRLIETEIGYNAEKTSLVGGNDAGNSQKASAFGTASTGLPDYTYMSWGANATGADLFSSYLTTAYGLENLPEIIVAVADSGVDAAHSVFSGRIKAGGKNFSTSEASSSVEYKDDNGHGTHVSGIIADLTLPNVKILPLKVINATGAASITSIIAALTYLSELKAAGLNIRAVNLSLSGAINRSSTIFAMYKSVLENIYRQNIIPVAAAGNDSKDASNYAPGNIECVLTVSAVGVGQDGAFEFAEYSNSGTLIDFAAPGSSIVSAYINGHTASLNGTSMAAPHVTAVVALTLSDPKNSMMTSKQAEAYLKGIATALEGGVIYYGYGLISTGYAPAYALTPTTDGEQGAQEDISSVSNAESPESDDISDVLSVRPPEAEIIANDRIFTKNSAPFVATVIIATAAALYVFFSRVAKIT
jgi:subtilisin family serine protease